MEMEAAPAARAESADADMDIDPRPSLAPAPDQDDDPRRFICHCGKRFVRNGHLARHMATHSAPRFKCDVCGASFSRSDVLQRHAGSHDPAAVSKRSACDSCHARKKKCEAKADGAPCDQCRLAGVACTYPGQAQRDGEARVSMKGLTAMLDIIKATPSTLPLKHDMEDSPPEIRTWYERCVEIYIREWHAKWPIISLFNIDQQPFLIWVSIILSACWSTDHSSFGYLILDIHRRLTDRNLELLVRGRSNPGPEEAWQVERYQAVLLLIILALSIAEDTVLERAEFLLGYLVTTLRQIGMFDSNISKRQNETHFPGSFVPYVVQVRERRSSLVAGLFKVDTYLSLRRNRPPFLQAEELDVNLPCTLALGHAHPLPVFFARHAAEPGNRKECSIFELCRIPQLTAPSMLLAQDVVLGLCGLWPSIWRLTRTGPRRRPSETGNEFILLAERLGGWQSQLEQMSSLISGPDADSEPARLFMKAYRGLEDERTQQGKEAALQRAKSLLEEGLELLGALRSALWASSFPPGHPETRR